MEKMIHLTTNDSKTIALWKIKNNQSTEKHLFLIHGTFYDKEIFNYLLKKSYSIVLEN
jgi:hypothetical protein